MENRDVLNEKLKMLEEKEQSPTVSICGILYHVISIGATIPYDAKDDIKEQEFLVRQQWIQEANILPQTATWVQLEPTEDCSIKRNVGFVTNLRTFVASCFKSMRCMKCYRKEGEDSSSPQQWKNN